MGSWKDLFDPRGRSSLLGVYGGKGLPPGRCGIASFCHGVVNASLRSHCVILSLCCHYVIALSLRQLSFRFHYVIASFCQCGVSAALRCHCVIALSLRHCVVIASVRCHCVILSLRCHCASASFCHCVVIASFCHCVVIASLRCHCVCVCVCVCDLYALVSVLCSACFATCNP